MSIYKNPFMTGGPYLMGIVNVTPDSFSDGGQFYSPDKAIAHGLRLIDEGAVILDIGGESTRPGAAPVLPQEEMDRVLPVIEGLKGCGALISIDTRHAATMKAALAVGAGMINDVSALDHDLKSLSVIRSSNVPVCLMHMQGDPVDMQENPKYNNMLDSILHFFKDKIHKYETYGIDRSRFIVDPGIGFGKTLDHNLSLLRNIKEFHALGCPILLGASRKSFIENIMETLETGRGALAVDNYPPEARLPGSLATALHVMDKGVQILRVHDVKETRQAIKVWRAIREGD